MIFIVLIIILVILIKKLISNDSGAEPLTKKLMNFISNDPNGKENEKPSSYNTIIIILPHVMLT